MWPSISSATITRARDGSATLASLYPVVSCCTPCQVLEQFDGTLVQIDSA